MLHTLRPASSDLIALAKIATHEQLDAAIRVLSVARDGAIPAWADEVTLVLYDAMLGHGCGVRDWSLEPPCPFADPFADDWHLRDEDGPDDYPAHGAYIHARRWLWWLRDGFCPRAWTDDDATAAWKKTQAENARIEEQRRVANVAIEQGRLATQRASAQSRKFNRLIVNQGEPRLTKIALPRRVLLRWAGDAGEIGWKMECRICKHEGWYDTGRPSAMYPPRGIPCQTCNLDDHPPTSAATDRTAEDDAAEANHDAWMEP